MSALESEAVERKRTPRRAKRSATRPTRPRSAVTSGRKLFVEGDPHSACLRRGRSTSDIVPPCERAECDRRDEAWS
jgi:hypothetical protein